MNNFFGTKAETLEWLATKSLSCRIPKIMRFTTDEWFDTPQKIIEKIQFEFGSSLLAVRSSASCEDSANNSMAGAFLSRLSVSAASSESLRSAIGSVISSYQNRSAPAYEPVRCDEVFVQEMVVRIDVAGVILTRCVSDGAPYYVFSYDEATKTTDAITAGRGEHKTVMMYRDAEPDHCDSPRLRRMLALARELESVYGGLPLDIEFALDMSGVMHLLQVRRIASVREWHPDAEYRVVRALPQITSFVRDLMQLQPGILGATTVLGNMPDWNPAELIGIIPSPLAASLFRRLISLGVWHQARASMGYRSLPSTDLLVLIAGHGYIDVRASFNSFLPADLRDEIGTKLIDYWIDRLSARPALHDKVELELVPTVLDFQHPRTLPDTYASVLDAAEFNEWLEGLTKLTRGLLRTGLDSTLACSERSIEALWKIPLPPLSETVSAGGRASRIMHLLDECRDHGTRPFAVLARHAFAAEALLRSAVNLGALTPERLAEFKASFMTIMGDLTHDTHRVMSGSITQAKFMERYGHLRPGTFDILSPTYRNRPALFAKIENRLVPSSARQPFELLETERTSLSRLLKDSRLDDVINPDGLLAYARRAIQGREYAKFVFTRHLSAALEEIALWGESFQLSRDELSLLRIDEILDTRQRSVRNNLSTHLMQAIEQARLERAQAYSVRLSYLIRGERDVYVVPLHRSEPTFLTRDNLVAPMVRLWTTSLGDTALDGKVVCIENADPGFDWIFTRGIAGLVTKYGGPNSHMAIRCAELKLPAAIGVGELLFKSLENANFLELNCASHRVKPVREHGR